MKTFAFLILLLLLQMVAESQNPEMDKFYAYYEISGKQKGIYDSVYKLIDQRRSVFSKSFKEYKEHNKSAEGFIYDWTNIEREINRSLNKKLSRPLKHLVYYSYFDLGYGIYGLNLNSKVIKKALIEIEPSSAVWAMEPSLLEPIIKAAGGEERQGPFLKNIIKQNKNLSLVNYVQSNLSPDRALKKGKVLPLFHYRDFLDTSKILSSANLKGKYYLIDIWATWCKPCIDEFPVLLSQHEEKKLTDLEFVSISIDDSLQAPKKFLEQKFQLPWPSGIAVSRKELMTALMITGIPCTILIDPAGKILSYGAKLRGANLKKTLSNFK